MQIFKELYVHIFSLLADLVININNEKRVLTGQSTFLYVHFLSIRKVSRSLKFCFYYAIKM